VPPQTHSLALSALGSGVSADEVHLLRVIKSDGAQLTYQVPPSLELSNGWDLTRTALEKEEGGIDFYDYGPPVGPLCNAILGEKPPDDGSWFWALYVYGSFTSEWIRAPSSINTLDLDTFPHMAWVAAKTSAVKMEEEDWGASRALF